MVTAGKPSLERLTLAWLRSPLSVFLRWWGNELTGMLPGRMRAWLRQGPEVLWLGSDGAIATVRRARTGAMLARITSDLPAELQHAEFVQACAGVDPVDRRLVLVVPAVLVLYRRLVLPAAAAINPRRVAGYELDRQTPFKAEQVYYDVHVSVEPVPAGHVALDLYVAPKAAVDRLLTRFTAVGSPPDAIDVQAADSTLAGVDLLPPARRPHRVDRRRRINGILAAACVVLVVLVLAQWLGNRRAALAHMQAEVAAMRAQATRSERLRAQLAATTASARFLVRRKAEVIPPLVVLNDLTQRLPATAWLDAVTLDASGGVDIKGEAQHAAALVNALAGSGVLVDPRLQGVIQPDPATGKERFELVARLRRQGAPDAH